MPISSLSASRILHRSARIRAHLGSKLSPSCVSICSSCFPAILASCGVSKVWALIFSRYSFSRLAFVWLIMPPCEFPPPQIAFSELLAWLLVCSSLFAALSDCTRTEPAGRSLFAARTANPAFAVLSCSNVLLVYRRSAFSLQERLFGRIFRRVVPFCTVYSPLCPSLVPEP